MTAKQVPDILVRSGPKRDLAHPGLFELTSQTLILSFLADYVQVPDIVLTFLLMVLLVVTKWERL